MFLFEAWHTKCECTSPNSNSNIDSYRERLTLSLNSTPMGKSIYF